MQQWDVDSGSDCNDIYEKQTMAALESFASDDDMRDSAIYSDGDEGSVITPISPRAHRYPKRASSTRAQKSSFRKEQHRHRDSLGESTCQYSSSLSKYKECCYKYLYLVT